MILRMLYDIAVMLSEVFVQFLTDKAMERLLTYTGISVKDLLLIFPAMRHDLSWLCDMI